ncbi:hypothetical protein [Aurantiacibacter luteus]|uniref:Uncharacterized protein n=1 Tax=Aurantiacibacter luteus TaxID=1581420 RepID=A0A0G9MYS0_9SPHN|nr:hypothetical protein [Aurantiacibacter luteus]KLE34428.1 hypothetical protein AAW00_09400 [Aurantiacibacter luteus]
MRAALALALLVPAPLAAQDASGVHPDEFDLADYRDLHPPPPDCDAATGTRVASAAGDIVVCGRRDETEEVRSVIRRPVRSDRRVIEGLTDTSCESGCVRMGWAPEPAIMVDVTAFPHELDEETAAAVSRADSE